VVLGAVVAAGCSGVFAPRPDPTHFFILSAISPSASVQESPAVGAPRSVVVGLGPIDFPDYLARAEMITRVSDDRVEVSASERWAEPLDISFKRVLAHDLSIALGGAQVAIFPWVGEARYPGYRVAMTIDRFDADAQGAAQLIARWTISASNPDRVMYSTTTLISVPASSGASTTAAVNALDQAVSQFAGQLAAAIIHHYPRG
jgi:hypothetical protein